MSLNLVNPQTTIEKHCFRIPPYKSGIMSKSNPFSVIYEIEISTGSYSLVAYYYSSLTKNLGENGFFGNYFLQGIIIIEENGDSTFIDTAYNMSMEIKGSIVNEEEAIVSEKEIMALKLRNRRWFV